MLLIEACASSPQEAQSETEPEQVLRFQEIDSVAALRLHESKDFNVVRIQEKQIPGSFVLRLPKSKGSHPNTKKLSVTLTSPDERVLKLGSIDGLKSESDYRVSTSGSRVQKRPDGSLHFVLPLEEFQLSPEGEKAQGTWEHSFESLNARDWFYTGSRLQPQAR